MLQMAAEAELHQAAVQAARGAKSRDPRYLQAVGAADKLRLQLAAAGQQADGGRQREQALLQQLQELSSRAAEAETKV